jgi:hypothetical protein
VNLTNEKLSRRFKSQFELVNYAIKLAENMIKTGRDPRIKTDIKNRAYQILQEITAGVDYIDDLNSGTPHVRALDNSEGRPAPSLVYDTKVSLEDIDSDSD